MGTGIAIGTTDGRQRPWHNPPGTVAFDHLDDFVVPHHGPLTLTGREPGSFTAASVLLDSDG